MSIKRTPTFLIVPAQFCYHLLNASCLRITSTSSCISIPLLNLPNIFHRRRPVIFTFPLYASPLPPTPQSPQMSSQSPLYLGFDLSTQQLKGIAVTSNLKVVYEAAFDFDADVTGFNVKKGVLTNEAEREVYAPIAMWLTAIDAVLHRLQSKGIDFHRVRGISGAGQQHGSVYWTRDGESALKNLHKDKTLQSQLDHAFSYPYSPNWQDASTQEQCEIFDTSLGDEIQLALNTGSKAHHVRPTILATKEKPKTKNRNVAFYRSADPSFQNQTPKRIPKDLTHFSCFFLPCVDLSWRGCAHRYI